MHILIQVPLGGNISSQVSISEESWSGGALSHRGGQSLHVTKKREAPNLLWRQTSPQCAELLISCFCIQYASTPTHIYT